MQIASPPPPQLAQDQPGADARPLRAALPAATLTSSLIACGGGGGADAGAAPAPPAPPATPSLSESEAARFLLQAGLHATPAGIEAVRSQGLAGWLDRELARPVQGPGHHDWMIANGHAVESAITSFAGAEASIWRKLLTADDALRQRMALALSELFVVSMNGLSGNWRGLVIAHYADLLEQHAFGNFRELLQAVTLSTAMGEYLNLRGNRKEDRFTGRLPDENYAREVMQLFTIGLTMLKPDGSPQQVGGAMVDSYTQDDISQLARVFTGWDFDNPSRSDYGFTKRPMVHIASRFHVGNKQVLGQTIPLASDGPQALTQALDILFKHPNVGPFVARQLIQRFTMSHPSPAYVGRVAAVFNDNGQGVRGDLRACLRALLLDAEARATPQGEAGGKLREPMLRFVQFARSFGMRSPSGRWAIGDTSDPATRLGQSPFRSGSVFNFFRPGYVPPQGELGRQRITVPELQICNESTVAGYLNFLQKLLFDGIADLRPDFSAWLPLAGEPERLLAQANLLLAGGNLSVATLGTLTGAVAAVEGGTEAGRLNRVRAAVMLVMASPEYQVQR